MRAQRGQIWSLDVVLAAVLFTLAIGLILSQTELNVFNSQQERNMRELHAMALLGSTSLTASPEILITSPSSQVENIRCGPSPDGWSYDYDLSWMPNCIVDRPGTLTGASLGLPPGFDVRVEADALGSSLLLTTNSPAIPTADPYVSITRRVLVLDASAGAVEFHGCMENDPCVGSMRDVTITVWRSG